MIAEAIDYAQAANLISMLTGKRFDFWIDVPHNIVDISDPDGTGSVLISKDGTHTFIKEVICAGSRKTTYATSVAGNQ